MRLLPKIALSFGTFLVALIAALAVAYVLLPVNIPLIGMLFGARLDVSDDPMLRERVELPPGFTISIYATDISAARFMQLTPSGHIIVAARDAGEVQLVLADGDGDGRADGREVLASGLEDPHSVWLDGQDLYVGEEDQITRFDYDDAARTATNREVVLPGLPASDGHYTRTVRRGPDGWLYVTIGSSCNACVETHPWRAAMIRFRDGAEPEIYATGLRNTVGFAWHPETGELWGVDNGRDRLGNDYPPDELNLIVEGGFYGWPYFNGDNEPDPDLGDQLPADAPAPIAPAYGFEAHVAPLSITFLRHQRAAFLQGAALVAQHGSWNRDTKIGYRVTRLTWNADGTIEETPFITGFEVDENVIGRPVDVLEAPDGTLYVSDDYADVIYRVEYHGG